MNNMRKTIHNGEVFKTVRFLEIFSHRHVPGQRVFGLLGGSEQCGGGGKDGGRSERREQKREHELRRDAAVEPFRTFEFCY